MFCYQIKSHSRVGGQKVDDARGGDDYKELDEDEQSKLQFFREVMDSLVTGIHQKTEVSKVALKIKDLRYAYNIPLETMQELVFRGVLQCYQEAMYDEWGAEWPAYHTVRQGLFHYSAVLTNYLQNTDDFISTIERMVRRDSNVLSCTIKLLCALSQELELIEAARMLLWFKREGARRGDLPSSDSFVRLKKQVFLFLPWLGIRREEARKELSREESSEEEKI